MSEIYQPPRVWQAKPSGGQFAAINRPEAGARYQQGLPQGEQPLQLYSLATPNGVKVTILLEELLALGIAEAEYDAWLIDIQQGEQFSSGFVALNPNSKIPALLDLSGSEPVSVFESGSILLYLAEKHGAFLPASLRTEVMNWLFWQMGSAPFVGGGFGHFYAYAPQKFEYPIDRYTMETKRQLDVLDRLLAEREYIAGADYTLADITIWPWYGVLALGELYNAAEFLQVQDYPHLQRWATQIAARPAVQRGRIVNLAWGEGPQLKERHAAADVDAVLASFAGH